MLQLENRVEHNINDLELAQWIVANFTEQDFADERYTGGTGFGCVCDGLERDGPDEIRQHFDENFYRLRLLWNDNPQTERDRELNQWFFRLFEDFDPSSSDADDIAIDVYYCSKCHQWAIDERL